MRITVFWIIFFDIYLMNEVHLKEFIECGSHKKDQIENNPFIWAKFVLPFHEFDEKLNQQFSRQSLQAFCKNRKNSDLEVVVAILAWGGTRIKNGHILFTKGIKWLDFIRRIRTKKIQSRAEAFSEFQELRKRKQVNGLGIASYTKLICFLNPELNGYILDQWTAKSINLIFEDNIVKLYGQWVSEYNNDQTYERYCSAIDEIASRLNCSGIEVVERLSSFEGGSDAWLNYVLKHYTPEP